MLVTSTDQTVGMRWRTGSGPWLKGSHWGKSAYRSVLTVVASLASFVVALSAQAQAPPDIVVFGGDANYPPFEWLQGQQPRGFNVDLAGAVASVGGAEYRYVLGDWPDILHALDEGQVDAVPMFRSEQREKRYLFTTPFHHVDHAIFASVAGEPVTGVEDLDGLRVVVEERSYAYERLKSEVNSVQVISAVNTLNALLAVEAGQADYAVLSALTAEKLIRQHAFDLRKMGPTFWPRAYAFAVSQDRPELAAWLTTNIQRAIADGQYAEVYQAWKRELVPGEPGRFAGVIAASLAVAMALIGLAALWVFSLRRTVRRRTSALRDELLRRRAAEEAARQAADFDPFGLARPHLFRDQVSDVLQHGCDNSEVWVIKLGAFERLIRTLDYETGRALTREFALRLQSFDFLARGRLSRDVFAVLTHGLEADRLLEFLSARIEVGPLNVFPDLRIGRARTGETIRSAHALIHGAEIALLHGIEQCCTAIVYDPSMNGSSEDLRLIGDFQASDGRDLFAVFQPFMDIRSGQIVGAEALVRWRHPKLGLISPAHFIPLLEQSGLIDIVTARMVDESMRVVALARQVVPDYCISVNVTAHDLVDPHMFTLCRKALEYYEVPAGALKLELTETSVVTQPDLVRTALEAFQAIGVGLSVDDFGTGHSSLSHLTSFPFSELKIDREFVAGITTDARKRSIVRSTLSMAKELGLAVVAEGVEDERTVTVLRHLGCDRAQGYGISKPLEEPDFLEFLAGRVTDGHVAANRNY